METRLVMVTIRRAGRGSAYRLVQGRVLPNGKTIVKRSVLDSMTEELGIQRGEAYTYG